VDEQPTDPGEGGQTKGPVTPRVGGAGPGLWRDKSKPAAPPATALVRASRGGWTELEITLQKYHLAVGWGHGVVCGSQMAPRAGWPVSVATSVERGLRAPFFRDSCTGQHRARLFDSSEGGDKYPT
jgi:hypothetical protein